MISEEDVTHLNEVEEKLAKVEEASGSASPERVSPPFPPPFMHKRQSSVTIFFHSFFVKHLYKIKILISECLLLLLLLLLLLFLLILIISSFIFSFFCYYCYCWAFFLLCFRLHFLLLLLLELCNSFLFCSVAFLSTFPYCCCCLLFSRFYFYFLSYP